ncbi:DNA modification methylase [Enterovirga sp. CN4-39]|uniref:DNA modification methylase n=1 Tax=Enterovirga sp. CN4-39 TaxID=3400910 RepID=UPI003BFA9BD2
MAITYRDPRELVPSSQTLRKPLKRRQEFLVQSLRRFGTVVPVLLDPQGKIVAGHGIAEAAKVAGLEAVPTTTLDHLSDAEQRALRISLNRLAELASWDDEVLRAELEFLVEFDIDLATHTGFSSAEIDARLDAPADPDDALPSLEKVAVSQIGDIWVFEGGHRLGCLNSLEAVSYEAVMARELAALALCDPPYFVPIKGHVTRRADARGFVMGSDATSREEAIAFLRIYLGLLRENCRDGALSLQWMDWRHMSEMLAAGEAVGLELINLIVWSKSNPGMGSLWRSAHELLFAWKSGTSSHVNNIELGRNGRNRSNVWEYPGANAFSSQDDREGLAHVTPKNVAMIQDAILDVSRRGDIVLDCFAGSGTTLIAAHRAKRRGFGLELDPLYVDLAVRRMEARTRAPARHAETGLTFAETATERASAPPPVPRARMRTRPR